jgi:impB/mucB/samB family C-terminal domain
MAAYVSTQAARALHGSGRQANGLSMTITYADGEARLAHTSLARPTSAGDEIAEAAIDLLRQVPVRGVALASIRLAMTDIELSRIERPAVREPARNFGCQMRQAPVQTERVAREQLGRKAASTKGLTVTHLSDKGDTKALQ